MKLCKCGRPVSAGHAGSDTTGSTMCLICWTERLMRDFRDPIAEKNQRAICAARTRRAKKGQEDHGNRNIRPT